MALQPAPSAQRTVEIVRFLADHPGEVFPVAELARRLEQSRATCQAVLLALEPSNWVRRTESGYALGAGLISIGTAAQRGTAVVSLLRDAARGLYQETGCEVIGYLPAGDQLVNVSRFGPGFPLSTTMVEGQAFPFSPPNGIALAAWDELELERWLARGPEIGARRRARLKKAAASVRRLGYSVLLDPLTRHQLESAIDELAEPRREAVAQTLAHDDLMPRDDTQARTAKFSFLAAPVFGAEGVGAALLGVIIDVDQHHSLPDLTASLLAATTKLGETLGTPASGVTGAPAASPSAT